MNRGLSLVELSIVLVILGLLTGGILAGQSLIRASELRAVSTEYGKYVGATQAFRDKYFALPGDMANAQSFWGIQDPTPATCKTTTSTSALTCNGDGDGIIASTAVGSDERMRFWQHLANAGLIEGQYTGVYVSFAANEEPSSKFGNGTWYAVTYGNVMAATTKFAGNYGHTFTISSRPSPYDIFSPEEAWNVDTKMDDGLPGTGRVIAWKGDATKNCTNVANSVVDAGATYSLSVSGSQCWLHMVQAF